MKFVKFDKNNEDIKHIKSVMVICDGGVVRIGRIDYDYYGNGYGDYIVRLDDGSNINIEGMHYCEVEIE